MIKQIFKGFSILMLIVFLVLQYNNYDTRYNFIFILLSLVSLFVSILLGDNKSINKEQNPTNRKLNLILLFTALLLFLIFYFIFHIMK